MHCRVIIAAQIRSPDAKRNAGLGTVRRREVYFKIPRILFGSRPVLAVGGLIPLITLLDHLAESTVVDIGVRRIELSAVEEIEVIHLEDSGNSLSEVKAFSYIGGLVI